MMNVLRPSILLLLFLGVSVLSSCIKDDVSGCFPSLKIDFVYQDGSTGDDGHEKNVIEDYVKNVILYVFDRNTGRFVTSVAVSREQLSSGSLSVGLPDGDYRFVCWGNSGDHTKLTLGTTFDESVLLHPDYVDASSVLNTNDPLYYSSTEVSVKNGQTAEAVRLDFICAYITLEVYIRGLESSSSPIVEFHNLTAGYSFDMTLLYPYSVTYRSAAAFDVARQRHEARFQVIRFSTDNPIQLDILNPTGASIYSLSLAEFMATHDLPTSAGGSTRAIVTEGVRELTIPIEVLFKGASVTVNVPSWNSGTVSPG